MESQLLRFEISSHLPLGWPFMPKDTSNKILLDDNFVVQDDAIQSMRNPFAFSEPIEEQEVTLPDIDLPDPPTSSLLAEASVLTQDTEPLPRTPPCIPRTPPCIPPRRSLAQQQATTTQDTRTTTTPPPPRLEPLGQNRGMSTPPRPASPAPDSSPRLRRTHRLQPPFMFFILAILFLLGTALGSSVARKGHFLFETVTPHVLVSPDTRTYARKLDFTTVKNSLKQLHKVKDQYITICHQILRSDTMVPTYLLVKDVTLEHDAATSCIRREYLPPTIEHSGEQKEMYDLLTEHKLRTAVSPYYGEGPGALQLNVLLDDGESLSPAVLPFTPDRFHTNIDGNFPSVFRVGSNNTIHLTFMFNASLSEMELPPLMKAKHALICKNPNAGFLTNFVTNSSTHPVLHSLCNTDRHSFETEISKLEKLLHILEPQYIASLEASYYNMDYKPPSFLTFPMPKNTQAFHPLPQQANASRFTRDSSKPMPPLGKSLTNFAKKISQRRKRALPALLAGGAIAALLVAGVVMSSVNMAKNADLQKQITDLAADVTDISLLQQDFQKALQDVAERQKNIAESLSHLDSATSASILLLQLKTSFNYIVLHVQLALDTFLDITTFARLDKAHEALLSNEFLLDLQHKETHHSLDLDPQNIQCKIIRNTDHYFVLLNFPIINEDREGSLMKVHSIPLFKNGMKFLPHSPPDFIVIMNSADYYIPLSAHEAQNCQQTPHNCQLSRPQHPPSAAACGIPLFFNAPSNCTMKRQQDSSPFFATFGNTTYYSVPSPTTVRIHCRASRTPRPGAEESLILEDIGNFFLENDCEAITLNGLKITSSNSINPPVKVADIFNIGPDLHRNQIEQDVNFTLPEFNSQPYQELIDTITSFVPRLVNPRTSDIVKPVMFLVTVLALVSTTLYYVLSYRLRKYIDKRFEYHQSCTHNQTPPSTCNERQTPSPPPFPAPQPMPANDDLTKTLNELRQLRSQLRMKNTLSQPRTQLSVRTDETPPHRTHLVTFKEDQVDTVTAP